MKNGMIECSVCHSKLVSPTAKTISRAYDLHKSRISSKQRVLNIFLVVGDCILVGLQPILVYMSKGRRQKVGEKPLLSISTFVQAARSNVLLAVPALLYAVNNYLKFIMQASTNCIVPCCLGCGTTFPPPESSSTKRKKSEKVQLEGG